MALQRLKEAAEKAKHELSSSLETEINLPFIATNPKGEPLHVQKTMTRTELELLTMELVERTLEPCRACLKDAKLSPSDIQSVVLVGGMTRMPAVQKAVKEFFGREPEQGRQPGRGRRRRRRAPGRRARRTSRTSRCCSSTSRRSRSASRRAAACSRCSSRATRRSRRSGARSSRPASTTRTSCRSTSSRASARWPRTTRASRASSSRASRRRRAASRRSR